MIESIVVDNTCVLYERKVDYSISKSR